LFDSKGDDLLKKTKRCVIECLVFNHQRVGQKIELGFFLPKQLFSAYFHIKTSNKHLYNLKKLIYQLKILLNWPTIQNQDGKNFLVNLHLLFIESLKAKTFE